MEKRLNRKIDSAFQDFKHQIKNKMAESDILSTTEGTGLLQFVYDFQVFAITKSDLQKRKRVKNSVPFNERCCALRANKEQCTRRKKNGEKLRKRFFILGQARQWPPWMMARVMGISTGSLKKDRKSVV